MITNIVIKNFKNFGDREQLLTNLGNLNIFVGKNNTGKTNLLRFILRNSGVPKERVSFIPINRLNYQIQEPDMAPRNIKDNETQVKGYVGDNLNEVSQYILAKFRKAEERTQKLILEYFKEFTGIDLEFKYDTETWNLNIEYLASGNQKLNLSNLGSGPRSAFALLVEMLWSDTEIILIDEPELGLHPSLQKRFFQIIKDIGKKGKQIFLATHSHIFIDRDDIGNNFKIDLIDNQPFIKRIETIRELFDTVYEQLGNSPTDLFFPANFVIVEGRSDRIFLQGLIDRLYREKLNGRHLQIQEAEGDIMNTQIERTMNAINKLYAALYTVSIYKDKAIILVDTPKEENDFKKFKESYGFVDADKRLRTLGEIGKNCLEETYPISVLLRVKQKEDPTFQEENIPLFLDSVKSNQRLKSQLAEKIALEIQEDEIPVIFKEVIEKAIEFSYS